jgi:hypothetical protein
MSNWVPDGYEDTSARCFMDGIDWQHHLQDDPDGTKLYPDEKSLRKANPCIESGGCGVVEVEVNLVRWVEPQNLKYENDVTSHARAQGLKTTRWDIADHLKTKQDIAGYLDAVLEDGDPDLLKLALGNVARWANELKE